MRKVLIFLLLFSALHVSAQETWEGLLLEDVEKILKTVDVASVDSCGRTPLMHYVMNNPVSTDILTLFIDAGADINARDKDGITVLMMALSAKRNPPNLDRP